MENMQIRPTVAISHDVWNKKLRIDIEMPNADEKNISLDLKDDHFCIAAPRDATEYNGCFLLGHEVEAKNAQTRYEDGRFRIVAPFKGSSAWDRLKEGFGGRSIVKG